jgi:hypothetical protein
VPPKLNSGIRVTVAVVNGIFVDAIGLVAVSTSIGVSIDVTVAVDRGVLVIVFVDTGVSVVLGTFV